MKKILCGVILVLLVLHCNQSNSIVELAEKEIDDLKISENFNFHTSRDVQLSIFDPNDYTVYSVYGYNALPLRSQLLELVDEDGVAFTDTIPVMDEANQLVFQGCIQDGQLSAVINVPSYIYKFFIVRTQNLRSQTFYLDIVGDIAEFNFSSLAKKLAVAGDTLLAVNGDGRFFTIDPQDDLFTVTSLPNLPGGSAANAIDVENRVMYMVCGSAKGDPYYTYDLDTREFTFIKNTNKSYYRLLYVPTSGLLYAGYSADLHVLDPATGNVISVYKIEGLHNSGGGDYEMDPDGDLYVTCNSGLYKLELQDASTYQATRISSEIPNFGGGSGMCIDSDGLLWVSVHKDASTSELWLMDRADGSFMYVRDISPKINDLAMLPFQEENAEQLDSDSDGIIDVLDKYPEDGGKAFETYTPSQFGYGTVAFEDLWPTVGDYDFNDLVINHRFISISNSQNKIVEIQADIKLENAGGSFMNGFGFVMDGVPTSAIAGVSGAQITEDFVQLDAKGLESGESDATIIVFDNSQLQNGKTMTIVITLTEPMNVEALGTPPFNPFIFINKDRQRELHLPGYKATSKFDPTKQFEYVVKNNDTDGNFKTLNNLPWAISIIHSFRYPLPGIAVNKAYNYFNEWAESNGTIHPDWYTDISGYRNTEKLDY